QSLGGDRPPFLVARAVALKALGRGAEAAAALAGAARVDPDLTDPRLFPDSGRGAVHAMERALADYPNQLRLRVTVAQLYLAARLWREAEAAAQVVLRERAGEPDALIVLGRARLGWGDREGALEALDRAVAAAPDLAAVRGARAEAYLALGRGADAEAELTLAVEADGRDALSMSRLATRLWERGELQKAEELWGYVLRRDPNAAAAHAGMAQAHERAKRPAEAEAAYRAAVASEPSNPRYYEALALFLERHGRARDAAPFKARARTVAAAARAIEARRARAGAYLAALARAAGRARAGDAAGVQAALTGVRGPQAPLAFVRAHLAARAGQSPLGPATAALGGLPGPRTFAAGSATVLQQTAALGRGERVRVTLFLPGVNPELLR
ncbi:MAG TPA: tetratricopeptide repeat protein, partial [Polyangia bacterium]